MSDTIDDYKALGGYKRRVRDNYGVECPQCKTLRPKSYATILIPAQRCRVDRYVDPRPALTDEQWGST